MRNYATAQLIGDRTHQCDATAVSTAPSGARAYVLLDGIGSSDEVRDWTRQAARRLARAAARRGDAEAGLRAVYSRYASEPDRQGPWGIGAKAAAVVAVTAPGQPLTVAWCGDARAYAVRGSTARRLTNDHNLRRIFPPRDGSPGGNRNIVTSCLGAVETDEETINECGHPAIETAVYRADTFRLVLASDGAYEPHEDAGHHLPDQLIGMPGEAARHFVDTAVATARAVANPYADNATVLIADIRPK
ncbi:serine/threonine protein phosphatase [Streptomyces griseoflavus]|uniref:mucin-2 n=1 Tax=Streptomyces griseoflavus TaxID=35619 RepID=UPI00167D6627|nr:mucin-2 [Streptomyces griseoflavus]GGV36971.1 serine/threonine protein phosphatase [Streptomyces griseoflavus]